MLFLFIKRPAIAASLVGAWASTWFKVPLEITRSGLGADQLRSVIKHHKGTITVEFDLSRPLFLDEVDEIRRIVTFGETLPRAEAPQVAVHRGFVDSGRSEVLQIGSELRLSARASVISIKGRRVI